MLALMVWAIIAFPAPSPDVAHICKDAVQWKDVNLPPGTTSDATNVKHVSLVYSAKSFAGVIYITKERTLWYQVGSPRAAVDEAVGKAAVGALGVGEYHQQRFYKLRQDGLETLVIAGYSLVSCY